MSEASQMPGQRDRIANLALRIHAALPQTQCRRCGYDDCRAYAQAIAAGEAAINRCPPGGEEGIRRLAAISGQKEQALDSLCGEEAPRVTMRVDEAWCIGCTLCIDACPTDAIVGTHKRMHSVIAAACTGCGLCLPVCPVDCITVDNASGVRTGWAAWSAEEADAALLRYRIRRKRLLLRSTSVTADKAAKSAVDWPSDGIDLPDLNANKLHASAAAPTAVAPHADTSEVSDLSDTDVEVSRTRQRRLLVAQAMQNAALRRQTKFS